MLQRTGQHALYNLLDSRGKCLCRQRPYPWSILGRSAHLGGKRSPARLLTTRTDHLFYPVFADLDSPHRQVLHLPTFDYVASHSL